jgi:hypothetical protein
MIEGGMQALNMETDRQLAEAAFPPNIELLEGMLINDPDNRRLHEYAAQAYYGYAYGFIEDQDRARAGRLYQRGLQHGRKALRLAGLEADVSLTPMNDLEQQLQQQGLGSVPALFWTASNWAKWIDMNRDQASSLAELPRAVALMTRVLQLDDNYFMSGPHVFFGVYYGSRSPMLGGDFDKSVQHFDQARRNNRGSLLLVDLLQAQYLERQRFNRQAFHQLLAGIRSVPAERHPEQGLINSIARHKAELFLQLEDEWF